MRKREYDRFRSCQTKHPFPTREAALEHIKDYYQRVALRFTELDTYQCRYFNHWHLTERRRSMAEAVV